jgi:hypothetical protein
MKQISQYLMIFTTILSLVLTGCSPFSTSQLPAPSPEPAWMVIEQKLRNGAAVLTNSQNGIPLANDIVNYALDKISARIN